MRNFKRTLALVLAVIMVMGTFATVSAAPADWYKEAVDYLENSGIATIGKTADEPMTRNEFVLWVSKIESHQLSNNAWRDEVASAVFTDVTDNHNKAAIAYAHNAGYIIGNGDGTFSPDKTISFAEASAVVVRLMGYESKVRGLAGAWDTNYILAASNYCRAFDQVFYKNVDTMNPDYELCKGEAAYILATIMNGINRNASNLILTAEDVDLGAWFAANGGPVAKENVYYIANLDRVSLGTSEMMTGIGNSSSVNANAGPVFTNVFNSATDVTLISADNGNKIVISGKEFLKALRVELGLNPTPDFMNEEAEIVVYDYVNVGTLVNVKIDNSKFVGGVATITNYKDIAGFEINTSAVVVDTYLQLGSVSNKPEYIGWSVKELSSQAAPTPYKPFMNASYDASLATSWTNVIVDPVTGEVTDAVLNFKGVAYVYGDDIVAYNSTWNEMTADEAVKTLINAAQGECYAVFHDIDEDGLYDTVYVQGSHAFAYTAEANSQPTDGGVKNTYNVMTSMSNGAIVGQMTSAYNNIGSVIYNREVGYPNNGGMFSSDAFNLTKKSTGKLQLVLCGSNARPVAGNKGCVPLYYTIVDLAAFYTGIIEEVSANYVDGYYTARIRCTDDVTRTVYIPVAATNTVALDVTVAGATAEYIFDSSAWFTFLKDTKDAATTAGIVQTGNVKDPNYLNWTAAWMAGKYVEFAANENNEVFCILGTDASTGSTGFVTKVEKTETGDNSYNVTIATSATVNYASFTQYYNAAHPITNAVLYDGVHTYQNNFGGKTIDAATSIVADDGKTYYKSNAASSQFWASTTTVTADTYYVCLDATTGKIYTDKNGNYADSLGRAFIDYENLDTMNSVSGIKTVEVRAAASGIFDWANYNVYNQLFKGILLDPNVAADKKVEAGSDLIYVTIMQDAGSNYVLYNEYPSTTVTSTTGRTTQIQVGEKAYTANRWYKQQVKSVYAAEASWYAIEDRYILSIEEVAGSRQDTIVTFDGVDYVNGYTALYNAKVGVGPYYDRTWNATSKSYNYDLKFTEVVELQNFVGTAKGILDNTKTLMVPLYENQDDASSNQVICNTAEMREMLTIENGFYVDKDNKVFLIVSAALVYKTDDQGKLVTEPVVYDYATATGEVVVGNDVSFTDTATLGLTEELAPYATMTVTDKPRTAEGWFPGAYYLTIDGVNYSVTSDTKVVVVTPSANGFAINVKSAAQIKSEGDYFVTEWNAVIGTGNTIETIAVLGQKAGSTKTPVAPEEPTVDDTTRLVYLDGTAAAYIRHDKYSNAWLVVSDKSAYALPNGEEVGAIYRSYPTYAEADNAIKIDLGIEGGKWYIIDENNRIVSSTDVELLTGTITETKADGTTIATMNGEKNVVISNMATEFFYFNGDRTTLYVAGDNTDVTIIAKAAYDALFDSYVKAVNEAQAAYDAATVKYEAGNLSDERYDYYKTNLDDAKAALANAKAESLDTYFNGQFWGFANSPLYKNFAMAQGTFQEGKPTLTFNYVIVDDVLCVFSDTFAFGA